MTQSAQSNRGLCDWLGSNLTAGRVALGLAVVVGMALRFCRLTSISMTADEGAAWAVAVAPVSRLLQLQPQLDSGKLALYHLILHYWIGLFGDSLGSIRSLSAAIGTISIVLIFALVRELCEIFTRWPSQSGELVAGLAALIFATNIEFVESARNARMYPLMTAAELAQIFFFLRTQHQESISNCFLAAFFLALAIAANFTAAFLIFGEIIWLGYLMLARWRSWPGTQLAVTPPALSLAGGLVLLSPFMPAAIAASRAAIGGGALDWIRYQPPLSWSYDVLRNNVGNRSLFRLFVALAAFGLWRHRGDSILPSMFMATVVVGSFASVAILNLLGRPMMVDRYVMLAQIGFLGLAALGASAVRSRIPAVVILLVILWLSARALRHSSGFWVDWKGAAAIACANSSTYAQISVVPEYAVNAVRYHLPPQRRALALGLDSECGNSQILILNPGHFIPPSYLSELAACYPRLLGRVTRAEVRAR